MFNRLETFEEEKAIGLIYQGLQEDVWPSVAQNPLKIVAMANDLGNKLSASSSQELHLISGIGDLC